MLLNVLARLCSYVKSWKFVDKEKTYSLALVPVLLLLLMSLTVLADFVVMQKLEIVDKEKTYSSCPCSCPLLLMSLTVLADFVVAVKAEIATKKRLIPLVLFLSCFSCSCH
ncbi:hypothetical protein AVEN_159692-1 [Araneus ventricosus]|uniref:Uncharacterized protein n=1 Tax=Araneus ventricosus TaxID=182803 RepID=A0A4Y2L6X9_ARAVE|nr:hypothetical protein AVEN_159692-1 [Araneus ventricosus]